MKMPFSLSARLDVPGLCLIAALAAACSFDTSQLRALADAATATGGSGGSSVTPSGGTTRTGGTTYTPTGGTIYNQTGGTVTPTGGTTYTPNGGTIYNPTGGTIRTGGTVTPTGGTIYHPTGGTVAPTGGTIYNPTGGTIRTGGTVTPTGGTIYHPTGGTVAPTGGTIYNPTGGTVTPTGGTIYNPTGGTIRTGGTVTPTGGTVSATPTGTTVTFVNDQAQGAMVGYGWVALGSSDSITDPTCGPGKTPITNATPCMTSTNWSSPTSLCISGSVPALGTPPDYNANWGVDVGVASDTVGGGLGQSFSSITIAVTGAPPSGLRAVVHRGGDPDATSYCYALTPGTAMPLTSFSTTCYTPASPGTAITAADVPKIDLVYVMVYSGTAAITVSNLCITGITFAK